MEFTGERYVPTEHGNIEIEHRHRYLWAQSLAYGKNVLDLACGEGYGSAVLAEHADHVTGVDVSAETILHAIETYNCKNLDFIIGSCDEIPCANESIDLVISFETIEHHDKHTRMMEEIKRVLKNDGVLLISCPDKLYYSDERKYTNKYHVKELYEIEFKSLIESYFTHVQYYTQRIEFGSAIFAEGMTKVENTVPFNGSNIYGVSKPLYRIAWASNKKGDALNSSFFEKSIFESEVVSYWRIKAQELERIIGENKPGKGTSDDIIATNSNHNRGSIINPLRAFKRMRRKLLKMLNKIVREING